MSPGIRNRQNGNGKGKEKKRALPKRANGNGKDRILTDVLTSAPVAYGRAVSTGKYLPNVRSNGLYTRISHSEAFATVISSGAAFAVSSFPLNPGVGSIFPWLSQIALRFETYKFRQLWFEYHTRVGSDTPGTVILAFDFDAQDSAPLDQLEALSFRDSVGDVVWRPSRLRLNLIEGDKLPSRYTRSALPVSPYDLKTLDLGNLHVCTDGVGAATVGLLEVHYTVDLFTPQIQSGMGGRIDCTAGLSAAVLFGTTITPDVNSSLPFVFTSSSVITFTQKFEGMIGFVITGTGLAADYNPVVSATGSAYYGVTQTVNAGTTSVVGFFPIKAVRGTTCTPTITATTVTNIYYYVSVVPYVTLANP